MQLSLPNLKDGDHDTWFCQQVRRGLESANTGNLIPAAEVEAKFAARRALALSQLEVTRPGSGVD